MTSSILVFVMGQVKQVVQEEMTKEELMQDMAALIASCDLDELKAITAFFIALGGDAAVKNFFAWIDEEKCKPAPGRYPVGV